MELRGRIMTGNLLIVILILQFCASFQQESDNFSFSSYSSVSSVPYNDRRPCVFRGSLIMHRDGFRIDRCTNCTCINSTKICTTETCRSDPGCEASERVISPHECCPRCPGVQRDNTHEFLRCSFRGSVLLQGQTLQLDPCTKCTCHNGKTICEVPTCPSRSRCPPTDIFIHPEICCPMCISTVTVKSLNWNLKEVGRSFYGRETPIRLDVGLEFREYKILKGVGIWRVGVFGSSDSAGFGERHYEVHQTLNEDQASMAKTGKRMNFRNISSDFQVGSVGCDHVRYVCVEFAKGDTLLPPFNLHFDFGSEGSSTNPFTISCKELKCSKHNMGQKVKLRQDAKVVNNNLK